MTQATTKTIDARGIAKLLGYKDSFYAYQKTKKDPAFPRPVSIGTGAKNDVCLWALDDILAWKKTHVKNYRAHAYGYPNLDNKMAQQIIRRGWKRGSRAIAQFKK